MNRVCIALEWFPPSRYGREEIPIDAVERLLKLYFKNVYCGNYADPDSHGYSPYNIQRGGIVVFLDDMNHLRVAEDLRMLRSTIDRTLASAIVLANRPQVDLPIIRTTRKQQQLEQEERWLIDCMKRSISAKLVHRFLRIMYHTYDITAKEVMDRVGLDILVDAILGQESAMQQIHDHLAENPPEHSSVHSWILTSMKEDLFRDLMDYLDDV
jgi:hypothetical protein